MGPHSSLLSAILWQAHDGLLPFVTEIVCNFHRGYCILIAEVIFKQLVIRNAV